MALLHQATISPSKGDLVAAWLPGRPWAPRGSISSGVSYRVDDPAGEVGMEGFLLTDTDGHTTHVPLTYRGRPLEGAQQHLIGTLEHSVLGARWVYDACGDPVWIAALASTIINAGTEAEEWLDVGVTLERREPQVRVKGSGKPGTVLPLMGAVHQREDAEFTTISGVFGELVVVRRVGAEPECRQTLTATWDGRARDVVLAGLRLR